MNIKAEKSRCGGADRWRADPPSAGSECVPIEASQAARIEHRRRERMPPARPTAAARRASERLTIIARAVIRNSRAMPGRARPDRRPGSSAGAENGCSTLIPVWYIRFEHWSNRRDEKHRFRASGVAKGVATVARATANRRKPKDNRAARHRSFSPIPRKSPRLDRALADVAMRARDRLAAPSAPPAAPLLSEIAAAGGYPPRTRPRVRRRGVGQDVIEVSGSFLQVDGIFASEPGSGAAR